MPAEIELSIRLTANEWNQVLAVLQDGAYRTVSPLIAKIMEQAQQQQVPRLVQPQGNADDNAGN
jgi:hypothetical protein